MGWFSKWLGRRRPQVSAPPCPDQARLLEAQRAAEQAGDTLDRVKAQGPRVERAVQEAERLRRQNHLGPSFWAWAEDVGRAKP